MDIELARAYKDVRPFDVSKLDFEYEKGYDRPAWIYVKGLPDRTGYIKINLNGRRLRYGYGVLAKLPLYLPLDYTKDELRRYYDKFAEYYDGCFSNLDFAQLLLSKIELKQDDKILEIGSGTGVSSLPFVRAGFADITLTDFSEDMLEVAKTRPELANCKFVSGDVRTLKFEEKFDVIFSVLALGKSSYFDEEEMPSIYKKVADLLKPNGKLAILGNVYLPPEHIFKLVAGDLFRLPGKHIHHWAVWTKL